MSDYLRTGFITKEDIIKDFPKPEQISKHPVAISECVQEIPCNPCVSSCPTGAISMENIKDPPKIDYNLCIGCGKCVMVCPGLALFLVHKTSSEYEITLPYEMLPLPKAGDSVYLLNREGIRVGIGIVKKVLKVEKDTQSSIITVSFEEDDLIYEVRNIEVIHG
ncbi:4Fe-4S binding protein [Caldisericum exile]|uniref:Dye-linked L-proline dehydrogenase gamma subunit n=1 Tax=Caldisericum exile (strain DSM 21853 / NBRC 104410 / AZM16c01) TaxID=511051 RepID=A0A7U6GEX5_CALEA|nr:4Fe-4S binding protein [Caldisericum exile]BAL81150.1 dye-linked L-proline dehydrogenase gamma subunit [Caldisericum exile AZM16c01]